MGGGDGRGEVGYERTGEGLVDGDEDIAVLSQTKTVPLEQ
jgi:hypothetical protein